MIHDQQQARKARPNAPNFAGLAPLVNRAAGPARRQAARLTGRVPAGHRRVIVVSPPAGLGDVCSGPPPLPLDCFSATTVLTNTSKANAQQAQWENDRNTAIYNTAYSNWVMNGSQGPPPNPPELLSTNYQDYMSAAQQNTGGQAYWVTADGSTTTTDPTGAAPIMAGTTYNQWTGSSPQLLSWGTYETADQIIARQAAQLAAARAAATTTTTTAPRPTTTTTTAPTPAPPVITINDPPATQAPAPVITPSLPPVTGPTGGTTVITQGMQDIGGRLQQSTASVLPSSVSSKLPAWLAELPIWQTGLAAAAIIYAYQSHQKQGRKR